jgi:hypothetical protein
VYVVFHLGFKNLVIVDSVIFNFKQRVNFYAFGLFETLCT